MSNPPDGGVTISGGTINAQNLAIVGAHGTVHQTAWAASLRQPLADLGAAIDDFQGAPATRDALKAAHAEIAGELDAPAPDKPRLLAKLTSLSQLAGPAATIAQAAAALAQVIVAVL